MHTQQKNARLSRSRHRNRKGLTLLELIVVLTVLVALAGILLPTLPNLLRSSHVAVCSTNIPELNKAVTTFAFLNTGQHPNQLDNLVDGDGEMDGLPEGGADFGLNLTVDELTADEVDSLAALGITDVIVADWNENPTFGAHSGAVSALAVGTDVLIASDDQMLDAFNVQPIGGSRYVVFGVGMQATIVGSQNGGIFEAPVHFSDDAGLDPNSAYSRYVLVYRIFADGEDAVFIGASALHDDGLENVNEHLEEFYN